MDEIQQYISTFSEEQQIILNKIRAVVKEEVPEATEKISYKMPSFYLNGCMLWYNCCKKHIGFYPKTSGIENFKEELKGYKTSKGAIQFPLDKPIPYDIIRSIAKFRANENRKQYNYEEKI